MRILNYLFIFCLLAMAVACVDDTAPEDAIGKVPNTASFINASLNFTAIATGAEYTKKVPMEVKGPSLEGISGNVTATISVDPSSTAVEGVHYSLKETTIALSPDNNLLGEFPVTMLTAGIEPPLENAPVLVLNVSAVTGGGNVIADAKKVTINFLYLCNSVLEGDYIVSILRSDNGVVYVRNETITKTGTGEYRSLYFGHYALGVLGGEPGFTFLDVCDDITVPLQNLCNYYSNEVYQDGDSYVLPNGDLHIEYTVTFAAGNRKYTCDYVKQ